ncbi:MAG: hypothetical protein Q8L98_01850 [Chlamydiales bacterium]|nr:hypothetical protein [Chlamydiales bacterium]
MCTNDETPFENLAYQDVDYELLNFLNSEESQEDSSSLSTETNQQIEGSEKATHLRSKKKKSFYHTIVDRWLSDESLSPEEEKQAKEMLLKKRERSKTSKQIERAKESISVARQNPYSGNVERRKKENELIERVLTSSIALPEEKKAKEILLRRRNWERARKTPRKMTPLPQDSSLRIDSTEQKIQTATTSVFIEKQDYKRKRSTDLADEETYKTSYPRLDARQEVQQNSSPSFMNLALPTVDDNPNIFFAEQEPKTPEKSIEQTAFDEWLCTTSPLRVFHDLQTEITPFRDKESHLSSHLDLEQEMYQDFPFSSMSQDPLNKHDCVETFVGNSFTDIELGKTEHSLEQTIFHDWSSSISPLRFDDEPIDISKSPNRPEDKESILSNTTLKENPKSKQRRFYAEFKERLSNNPTEADLQKLEKDRERARIKMARRRAELKERLSNNPTEADRQNAERNREKKQQAHFERTLRENNLIEQVLTSDTPSPKEQQAKAILMKRKKTPKTVDEVQNRNSRSEVKLVHLWVLNHPLTADDEKKVKKILLKEIEGFKARWGVPTTPSITEDSRLELGSIEEEKAEEATLSAFVEKEKEPSPPEPKPKKMSEAERLEKKREAARIRRSRQRAELEAARV